MSESGARIITSKTNLNTVTAIKKIHTNVFGPVVFGCQCPFYDLVYCINTNINVYSVWQMSPKTLNSNVLAHIFSNTVSHKQIPNYSHV